MSAAPARISLAAEIGVFAPDELDAAETFFREHGFAVLRGLWSKAELDDFAAECAAAQDQVRVGALPAKFGETVLTSGGDANRVVNYVQYITQIAPKTRAATYHPAIVELISRWIPGAYLSERARFGVVYQDARPGRDSGYARIGWHSDWQSGPHLDRWPSVAFTIHIDGTGPDNGFLRVVPGSHLWATPAPYNNANGVPVPEGARAAGGRTPAPPPYPMPLRFEKIPGEIALYCEAGDLLFHDAYLWHSAARATDDTAIRRHVRGGWFSGPPEPESGDFLEDFVKNAAR